MLITNEGTQNRKTFFSKRRATRRPLRWGAGALLGAAPRAPFPSEPPIPLAKSSASTRHFPSVCVRVLALDGLDRPGPRPRVPPPPPPPPLPPPPPHFSRLSYLSILPLYCPENPKDSICNISSTVLGDTQRNVYRQAVLEVDAGFGIYNGCNPQRDYSVQCHAYEKGDDVCWWNTTCGHHDPK